VIPDYTLVIGVDEVHLRQLSWTWRTWRKHKPSLLERPLVIFYDRSELTESRILKVTGPRKKLTMVPWPPPGVEYERGADDRFGDPQRYKMLAGFVHVAAQVVFTPYWLKLDTDVIATGQDQWEDPEWFRKSPAIISHPWGFTKPADQMVLLDQWVEENARKIPILAHQPPLDLRPEPGWERLRHPRIISFCCFSATHFTRLASRWAVDTCGEGKLPCSSQDGYIWYVATRMGYEIKRPRMKPRGWEQRYTMTNIAAAAREALGSPLEVLEVQDAE